MVVEVIIRRKIYKILYLHYRSSSLMGFDNGAPCDAPKKLSLVEVFLGFINKIGSDSMAVGVRVANKLLNRIF